MKRTPVLQHWGSFRTQTPRVRQPLNVPVDYEIPERMTLETDPDPKLQLHRSFVSQNQNLNRYKHNKTIEETKQ